LTRKTEGSSSGVQELQEFRRRGFTTGALRTEVQESRSYRSQNADERG
jgi:hypothetical protein